MAVPVIAGDVVDLQGPNGTALSRALLLPPMSSVHQAALMMKYRLGSAEVEWPTDSCVDCC